MNEDTLFFLDALKAYQEQTGDLSDAASLPTGILNRIVRDAQRLKKTTRDAAVK